jgi:N utilization substance protein B
VNISVIGKQKARKLAMQSLYQWQMANADLVDIEAQFRAIKNMERVDVDYYKKLLYGIPQQLKLIEDELRPFLDREVDSLNPVELAILRIGAFEILECVEIPYRVVLDEGISLAREFGSQDGYKYVNGVLHNLAKKIRIHEK